MEQVRKATVDVVDVETGDLHRSATDTPQGLAFGVAPSTIRCRFGCGHTTDTSSVSSDGSLTISCGANNQEVAAILP
jgi:hypothetical protein